mmetsp:Transcript_4225/g.5560  ORF Transcript_4225/g.5560 Transcript_4225/m.5560 type:complete len:203 (-) Transcript_4225:413-1021(-)
MLLYKKTLNVHLEICKRQYHHFRIRKATILSIAVEETMPMSPLDVGEFRNMHTVKTYSNRLIATAVDYNMFKIQASATTIPISFAGCHAWIFHNLKVLMNFWTMATRCTVWIQLFWPVLVIPYPKLLHRVATGITIPDAWVSGPELHQACLVTICIGIPRMYLKNNFVMVEPPCTWMGFIGRILPALFFCSPSGFYPPRVNW